MAMGNDDMNYINPANPLRSGRVYQKQASQARAAAERVFRSKQDIVVPAGTVFARAPLERGGVDRTEGIVGLGSDATAYLNLPVRVVEIDAKEWFEEITNVEGITQEPGHEETTGDT